LSKQQLTFTASNWTQPQRVTLTGLRTDQATKVSLKSASTDQQYANLSTQQRIVPSGWSSELELSLWEGGVQLLAQPAASVLPIDGTEGPASHFGFDLSLGAPAQGSPVELLYTLGPGAGFVLVGGSADVIHKPDAIYRPLVLTNTASSGGKTYANLGNLTTVSDRGEFSAQAWVRRDATDGGDTALDFSNASGQNEIWLGFADSSNKPRLVVRSSSGAVLAQLTADSPVALSEWNHLAFSIDSTNVASLYVNGELAQRQKLSAGISRLARASNFLGRSVNGEYLDGAIRGVAIWNAARSQDEIQASMLSETQDGSGLVSCLPLNNSLTNQVGSAPSAVLVNGSTNKASFATDPIYGLQVPVGESRVSLSVTVIDDLVAEGEEPLTLSLVDSGRYSIGGSSATGTAELSDNDSAGIDFLAAWSNLDNSSTGWTTTSQFTVSETDQAQKTQTRMGVRLTSRPTADVRLNLKSNSGVSSDIRVNLASNTTATNIELLFTPDNWDTVQELGLQGIDDKTFDGDLTRQLDFKLTSTDRIYADLSPGVSVLVLDDETYTANTDLAASQNGQAPMVRISAPTQSTIKESGTDSAQFTITLAEPARQDTLVFFNLEQSNRQLYARDFVVTASQNAQSLNGLARFDTSNTSSTEITRVDSDGINETAATFAANGQSGNFTSTWSGYIAIPETGSYYFSTMVQGGVRLRLDGKTVIDQMIDTKATWSTETLQLTRGDFVALSLDYKSFNTSAPALSLSWQRPRDNAAESVNELVPAEALSRVDGIHLLIAKGSSSATVTVAGVDDSIDENDEALDVRLLNARGVELVVSGQSTATDGNTLLDFTLGTTDREAVTLAAGTVLSLGKNLDSTGGKSSKLAQFTTSETVALHRDRSARIRGTLVWVDEATKTSYSGSVVNLVTSTDNDLYQVPDRSTTLSLTAPLVADSAAGQGRYLASFKMEQTNLGSVTIPAGTKLVYRTPSTNDTASFVLVNSLTLQSGQTLSSVAVRAESVSSGLDLTTSASPLVGLKSIYEIPNSAVVTILDDDRAGLQFYTDKMARRL
ncbi:MAG: LamG-like jellyroll fold domain-containing protein, partial [bacterium]